MKFSCTKTPESEFFIKNPNLTKKKFWRLGGEEWGVSKESKSEKKLFYF